MTNLKGGKGNLKLPSNQKTYIIELTTYDIRHTTYTMIYHLENTNLKITVDSQGAELKSVFNKLTQQELLWQGNP